MARFEERAPLELTKPRSRTILRVCPHCHTGRYVSVDWYSGTCGSCNKYFNKETALGEDEVEKMLSRGEIVNPDFIKLKDDIGSKAEKFKEKTLKMKSEGKQRSHEPGGKKRDW